jgi:hypothetical protein
MICTFLCLRQLIFCYFQIDDHLIILDRCENLKSYKNWEVYLLLSCQIVHYKLQLYQLANLE